MFGKDKLEKKTRKSTLSCAIGVHNFYDVRTFGA